MAKYAQNGLRMHLLHILLLASKTCFLISQGLVGARMNCRALPMLKLHTNYGTHHALFLINIIFSVKI
jgi:hypothetical protein